MMLIQHARSLTRTRQHSLALSTNNNNTTELSLPYVSDMSVPPMKPINRADDTLYSLLQINARISFLCVVVVANRLTATNASHRFLFYTTNLRVHNVLATPE
ncbi:hypothetical protein DPX16_6347 [Anabarilius grahami]|uniref:Uncharacterized protein n=1 Tax=Anabarilius grahami TaxID=495550 RepID=A0A3N0YUS6_ANAGA|nr:hypothetical protein DPX16_6347 [Anabarilius grahami]